MAVMLSAQYVYYVVMSAWYVFIIYGDIIWRLLYVGI